MNPLIRAGIAAVVVSVAAPALAGALAKLQGDGFTLLMPGTPQKVVDEVRIPGGVVAIQTWTAIDDKGVLYSISASDYPEAVAKARPGSQFVQEAKNGLATQLKGTVTLEKAVQLAGNEGIEFAASSENGDVKARSFMIGRRLYTLLVLYNPSIGAPQAQGFLASLKLTN